MANSHDWISLVGISGLTVSEPVLLDTFPDGPPALSHRADTGFRREFNRWLSAPDPSAAQKRWLRYVLEDLLGHDLRRVHSYPQIDPELIVELVEYEQRLYPNRVLVDGVGKPLLLIVTVPPEQGLDRRETETGRWRASPLTKLNRLLRETGVPLGLLTNGDTWRLIFAHHQYPTTSYMEWSAQGWSDERATLRAFVMLLGADRFDGDPPETDLIDLILQSQDRQIDVADQLGDQVRAAIRVFIRTLDEADQSSGGDLLAGLSEDRIYQMTIVFMMRLVFILYAEEWKLLPHGDVLYDRAYGLTYLFSDLRRQHRERPESMAVTHDAWLRLLAAFNVIYDGVEHPDFNMRAYGGDLFDPTRFPVLLDPRLSISNAIIHDILMRLLMAQSVFAGERVMQRVSYRSLGVEQFGYMYEGLLDHIVCRADQSMLALQGTKHKDPVLPLADLESLLAEGEAALIGHLAEHTGRSESALRNGLSAEPDESTLTLIWSACYADEDLYRRCLPFAGLLEVAYGVPPVNPAGVLYLGEGPTRRATGTHYTPTSLTKPIVQHTLEPLVYVGPAEGLPREEWTLKPARDLLDLKICDMAMGSGAFLVQVCRYLAERLVDAWEIVEHDAGPGVRITPYGQISRAQSDELLIPEAEEERETLARRLVADRCIYGVDKNKLAVEIARLSMWFITMDRQRPFTFLNHALKSGDSLVGVSLDQLQHWNLDIETTSAALFADRIRRAIDEVTALRREIASTPVESVEDQKRKEALLTDANAYTHDLRVGADLLVGTYFNDLNQRDQDALRGRTLEAYREGGDIDPADAPLLDLGDLRPFHWELEFPEVFTGKRSGFDGFVGNPPFVGGKRITGTYGMPYRNFITDNLASGKKGSADLCGYFFLRAFYSLNQQGTCGLIATNTIAQGETREASLALITASGGTIYQAERNRPWPGAAAVVISTVHILKGNYEGEQYLDNEPVPIINDMLDDLPELGEPHILKANDGLSFIGSYVLGKGFVLEPEEAQALIERDPRNKDVLFPYLNGRDLNQNPDQSPSRWVINFHDWDEAQAMQYLAPYAIIQERVKPVRQRRKENGEYTLRKPLPQKWWIYADKRPALYQTIATLDRVLVVAIVSRTVAFTFVPNGWVYAHKLAVLCFEDARYLALLQSSLHYFWAWRFSSTMKMDLNYSPSDVFGTFPFPSDLSGLDTIGETYHETRRQIMLDRWEGLTATYNRFHDPAEQSDDIVHLRALHIELDQAVAAAYGWADLDLGHGFRETQQGLRYTISEPARREVLTRLLRLNHQRYQEEVRQGLHGDKAKKELAKQEQSTHQGDPLAPPTRQMSLFDDDTGGQRQMWLGEALDDDDDES